jgi:serum/glucocorticoid-regulated kinase 2
MGQSDKRFNENIVKFMAVQLITAIEYMHSKNIIYRDIKAENIMIDSNGNVKLVDFGLSKVIAENSFKDT